jgi:Peptidase propeptide and YPEB domain
MIGEPVNWLQCGTISNCRHSNSVRFGSRNRQHVETISVDTPGSPQEDLIMRLTASTAILVLSVLPALADRPVTEDERAKLVAAVQAEGCSGGKFEMDEDDEQFEVDDAVCADGKKYDLKFDMQMKLKRKNLD